MLISRAQFIRGDFSDRFRPIRPPWAKNERNFIAVCDGCSNCVNACPKHILVVDRGGYPQVDFSKGGCTFCGECVRVCDPEGLQDFSKTPWNLKAHISKHCLANEGVECRVCGDQCKTAAIGFRPQIGGTAIPLLNQARCTGCGMCVSACPTQAISMLDSVLQGEFQS